MTNPTDDEITLTNIITSYIESSAEWYQHIDIGLCLMKYQSDWKVIAGLINVVPKLDEVTQSNTLDYGDIILSRYQIPISGAQKFIDSIVKDRKLIHPDLGEIEIEGSLTAYSNKLDISFYKKESQYQWGYSSSRWPYYYFEIGLNRNRQPETRGLVKKGLPLYPTWYDGAHHFLHLGRKSTDVQSVNHIPIIIPDPRARIQQIIMHDNLVTIESEPGELKLEEIMVKMYAACEDEITPNVEISLGEMKKISHEFPFYPEELTVYLIDLKGNPIDNRDINLTWAGGGRVPSGVIIEPSEDSLLQHLEKGESQYVEYKISLDDKRARDKIPKAISSFANASGGILFLGVNDEGVPVKSIEQSEQDRISQIISEHIEPLVEVKMQQIEVRGCKILAVIIPEGEDKPYVVKDRGVFIRYNGTTKQANRNELFILTSK